MGLLGAFATTPVLIFFAGFVVAFGGFIGVLIWAFRELGR